MTALKNFLTRYKWAGPIILAIRSVIGFVAAQYWQIEEFRLKQNRAALDQIRAEKELYERLQILQNQASDAIPKYIVLRDNRFATPKTSGTTADFAKIREVQLAFNAEKGKLLDLIREYNQLEAKLSAMEVRQPRWFVLPLPPMAPTNLRVEYSGDRAVFRWDPPPRDPLAVEVEKDLRELFRQYGQKYPESPSQPQQK